MSINFRDRIKRLIRVPAGQLRPHPKNWRRHPAKQRKAMRAVLREIGYADAVIAREDENGELTIIDGHLRVDITPDTIVPVLVVDLSEEEGEKLLGTLDVLAAMAEPDEEAWAKLIDGMQANSPEFQELLDELNPNPKLATGLTEDDAAPEVPKEPITRQADLWCMDEHRVLCGDCTVLSDVARLMGPFRADLAFEDPPYSRNYGGGRGRQHFGPILNDDKRGDEFRSFLRQAFEAVLAYKKVGAAVYICCSWHTMDDFRFALGAVGLEPASCIAWDKQNAGLGYQHYRPQYELIFYCPGEIWLGGRDESDVWQVSRDATVHYQHPTQKPVGLIERAIRNSSEPGNLVMDLCAGSGSTLIACQKTGRVARLMEQDPRYVDVIVTRWQQYTGLLATLDGDGRTFEQIRQERGIANSDLEKDGGPADVVRNISNTENNQ